MASATTTDPMGEQYEAACFEGRYSEAIDKLFAGIVNRAGAILSGAGCQLVPPTPPYEGHPAEIYGRQAVNFFESIEGEVPGPAFFAISLLFSAAEIAEFMVSPECEGRAALTIAGAELARVDFFSRLALTGDLAKLGGGPLQSLNKYRKERASVWYQIALPMYFALRASFNQSKTDARAITAGAVQKMFPQESISEFAVAKAECRSDPVQLAEIQREVSTGAPSTPQARRGMELAMEAMDASDIPERIRNDVFALIATLKERRTEMPLRKTARCIKGDDGLFLFEEDDLKRSYARHHKTVDIITRAVRHVVSGAMAQGRNRAPRAPSSPVPDWAIVAAKRAAGMADLIMQGRSVQFL